MPDFLKQSKDTNDPFDDDDDTFSDESESKRDPLISLYPYPLCPALNNLKKACLEDSILELFGKSGNISLNDIEKLTNDHIVDVINTRNVSEMFSIAKDFRSMLGDVQYNATGHIISARVASLCLYGKMNVTEANLNHRRNDVLGNQISIECSKPLMLALARCVVTADHHAPWKSTA